MKRTFFIQTILKTFFIVGILLGANLLLAQPFAYVTNYTSDTVSVIDTSNDTVIANVAVGDGPQGIAIAPDGSRIYVAHWLDRFVSVIDTAYNAVLPALDNYIDIQSLSIAITPDGSRAYTTSYFNNRVQVIDLASNTTTGFEVGSYPSEIAVTPNGSHVYVLISGSNNVIVVDTATDAIVDTIGVGLNPTAIAITPDGARVYVANTSNYPPTVSVINTANNTVIDNVGVENSPSGIAITPNGSYAYVTNYHSNSVSVIDTATNMIVNTIGVENKPRGIAITPDGSYAYVTLPKDNSVSVIDIATNMVVNSIGVGSYPFDIVVANIPVLPPVGTIGTVTVSDGGTVTSDDDTIVFDVPAGSVAGDTNIQVVVEDVSAPDVIVGDGSDPATALAIYEFGPDGTTFEPPATLTLKIDVTALSETQRNLISIYRHEDTNMDGIIDEGEIFVHVDGANCVVDEEPAGSGTFVATCEAPIAHFSKYAIIQLHDSDGDGVSDKDDMCPSTSSLGFDVDNDGCIDSFDGLTQLTSTLVAEGAISETMEKSLISKTDAAGRSATKDNLCASINQLEALKNQVAAQTDKKVSQGAAEAVNNYVDSVVSYSKSLLDAGDSCDP